MRSNVYGGVPHWFREIPPVLSGNAATYEYREVLPSAAGDWASDWAGARATVLAGAILAGLAGLVLVGAVALLGALGFGIWQLWT